MSKQRFKDGDHIIRYGDQGKSYYVLTKGTVKVVVYNDGVSPFDPALSTKIKFTKQMQAPVGFGEIALLYNDKRTAAIFAEGDCEAYELDGKLFKNVVIKANMDKRAVHIGVLSRIKLFGK